MIIPDDTPTISTDLADTSITATINPISLVASGYGTQSIIAYSADTASLVATAATGIKTITRIEKVLRAIFTFNVIEIPNIDLTSPLLYKKVIKGEYIEDWDLDCFETFLMRITMVRHSDMTFSDTISSIIGTTSTSSFGFSNESFTYRLKINAYDTVEISEEIHFSLHMHYDELMRLSSKVFAKIGMARYDEFTMEEYFSNFRLRINPTNNLNISEHIRFDLLMHKVSKLSLSDHVSSTLKTATTVLFSMVDYIGSISLGHTKTEPLVLQEIPYVTVKTILSDTFWFEESIPTYVQRVREEYDLTEEHLLELTPGELHNYTPFIDVAYTRLETSVKGQFDLTLNESLKAKIKRSLMESLNITETISGYVDNYYLPGYSELGYAGIPI